jgi:hypothetical protein
VFSGNENDKPLLGIGSPFPGPLMSSVPKESSELVAEKVNIGSRLSSNKSNGWEIFENVHSSNVFSGETFNDSMSFSPPLAMLPPSEYSSSG